MGAPSPTRVLGLASAAQRTARSMRQASPVSSKKRRGPARTPLPPALLKMLRLSCGRWSALMPGGLHLYPLPLGLHFALASSAIEHCELCGLPYGFTIN
eukprot:scaffold22227_cov60-Phaeocystis_antarctica.AAC.3